MKLLVTGSSGHLGEALVRRLREAGHDVVGLDVRPSPHTDAVGSVADRGFARAAVAGRDAVVHAATLHKPHVATHPKEAFVETNVAGTLQLLEAAVALGAKAFVFTSTTSVFGRALAPSDGRAVWVTEELEPRPRNIYGATKRAAEDLCELVHREHGLPCLVLRTSRFFPETDDAPRGLADENVKANEYLHRRVDLEDVVSAHEAALGRAASVGFDRFVITATTPFSPPDCEELLRDAPAVVAKRVPEYAEEWSRRGWRMFPSIDRVYSNERARRVLGWKPRHDFARVVAALRRGESPLSPLARAVGRKGYHPEDRGYGAWGAEESR
jgi:nucleoside-diphosphate-sugar epimerase